MDDQDLNAFLRNTSQWEDLARKHRPSRDVQLGRMQEYVTRALLQRSKDSLQSHEWLLLLRHPDAGIRKQAVQSLATPHRSPPDQKVRSAVEALVTDPDPFVSRAAQGAVERLETDRILRTPARPSAPPANPWIAPQRQSLPAAEPGNGFQGLHAALVWVPDGSALRREDGLLRRWVTLQFPSRDFDPDLGNDPDTLRRYDGGTIRMRLHFAGGKVATLTTRLDLDRHQTLTSPGDPVLCAADDWLRLVDIHLVSRSD